jgi:hypothetical protein
MAVQAEDGKSFSFDRNAEFCVRHFTSASSCYLKGTQDLQILCWRPPGVGLGFDLLFSINSNKIDLIYLYL